MADDTSQQQTQQQEDTGWDLGSIFGGGGTEDLTNTENNTNAVQVFFFKINS